MAHDVGDWGKSPCLLELNATCLKFGPGLGEDPDWSLEEPARVLDRLYLPH